MAKAIQHEVSMLIPESDMEKPADLIIRQIRKQIGAGQLKPGDRLPAERKLVEQFGVGRRHVREALRKLELYGILRTLPQCGTYVAGLGIPALEGLISDVLAMEYHEFSALVETRRLLETHAVKLAAERRTVEDIMSLQKALSAYEEKVEQGILAVEEDLMFHLKIAEASRNPVLKSLMLIIIPDIIKTFLQLEVCKDDGAYKRLEEHRTILDHIIAREPDLATLAIHDHLHDVVLLGEQFNDKENSH